MQIDSLRFEYKFAWIKPIAVRQSSYQPLWLLCYTPKTIYQPNGEEIYVHASTTPAARPRHHLVAATQRPLSLHNLGYICIEYADSVYFQRTLF